jgi:hypothetical protein
MKYDRQVVASLVCLLIVCGCNRAPASRAALLTPQSDPTVSYNYRTYPVVAETAWVAALAALVDRSYNVVESSPESRTVSSDWVETESRELSEGRGLLRGGERRGGGGILNVIAVLPETKGSVSSVNPTVGKEGESGYSTTTTFDQEVGVWSRCRHRMTVRVVPTGIDECGVEARSDIECWEQQMRKAWTVCRSRFRVESEFFDALEGRLGR